MKYVKYIITLFFCVLTVNVYAATSNFEPTINMEPDITENQISIIVGYKGENIMALTQYVSYERDYLTLIDVTTMDNFVVTKSNEKQEANFQTLMLLADSDYAFEDINYAVLTFEVNDKFKVGKSSKIFMYTYEAIGPNKDKYRHKGYEMTLRRDEVGTMAFLLKEIDSSTKREYWLSQNYLVIIAVVLVILGIVLTIFLIPTKRKKEARAEKIRNGLNNPKKKEEKDVVPIKIDYDFIEDLGTVKKEVDMSQAIEVSDLKPFGEAEGKFTGEGVSTSNVKAQVIENNEPKVEETPQIDAFNMKISNGVENSDNTSVSSQQAPKMDNNSGQESNSEPAMFSPNNLQNNNQVSVNTSNDIQEIPEEKKEELFLFQPKFIDNIDQDDNNDNNSSGGSSNSGLNMMSFILLMILPLSILITNARALEYNVDELRNCIVGNIPYNAELDYNGDGRVDVADIIETKDLTNTTLEEDKPSYNFKPVESEGVYVTEPTEATTTTKGSSFNINTTVKSTTTAKGTTARTTTKAGTTAKTTTTRKAGTTTTAAATYTVTLSNTNSTADSKSVSVVSGKSATFKVTPNMGYVYDSVSCSAGSATYNKSTYKLTVSSVKMNISCTINFKERDDMKVTISASHGRVSPATVRGAFKASASSTVTPSTGYQYASHSCTNGLTATYTESSNTLTIKSLIADGSCSVVFEEKTYTMTIKASTITKTYTAKYNQANSYTIEVNKALTKLRCNGLSKNFTVVDKGSGIYQYTFSYTMTKDTECVFS